MMVDGKCDGPLLNRFSKHCLLIVLLIILLTASSSSENDSVNYREVFAKIGGAASTPSGYVEVSFDGDTWVKLDPENGDWEVGHVVCRQQGFGPPSYASSAFVSSKEPRVFLSCDGYETTLSDCKVKTNSSFYTALALKVSCLPASSTEFDVALATYYTFMDSGVVLSFVNGHWGPICVSAYTDMEVCTAICKQLGYRHCGYYPSMTNYGVDILEMPVIGELKCDINAKSLKDCRLRRLQNQTCSYPEDKHLEVSCAMYGSYGDGYGSDDSYSGPANEDFEFLGRGQVMAYIAIVVTALLCVMMYMCHKRNDQNTPTLGHGQQSTGRSPPSSSLLPPYHTAARAPHSRSETDNRHPHESHLMYHPQPDSSPGLYPMFSPPAYATNDPVSATPSQDMPSRMDPDLPTYEEAIANKIDTEDV